MTVEPSGQIQAQSECLLCASFPGYILYGNYSAKGVRDTCLLGSADVSAVSNKPIGAGFERHHLVSFALTWGWYWVVYSMI